MSAVTNDAVMDLARIIQSASRMTADLHRSGVLRDRDEEIPHMRANLDHLVSLLDRAER